MKKTHIFNFFMLFGAHHRTCSEITFWAPEILAYENTTMLVLDRSEPEKHLGLQDRK